MSDVVQELTGAEEVAWDLSDLYAGIDDPGIEQDMNAAEARADALDRQYRGRIAGLGADELRALVKEYEGLLETFYKAAAFAQLHWTTKTDDPARGALLQKVRERSARLQQKLVFITLEWANAPDAAAQALIDSPTLARYRHFLETTRRYRPHLLTEPEEKILAEKAVTGRSAWARYFGEVLGRQRYDFDGQQVPQEAVLSKLHDRDRETRRRLGHRRAEGPEPHHDLCPQHPARRKSLRRPAAPLPHVDQRAQPGQRSR